jgi:hypothetical protein
MVESLGGLGLPPPPPTHTHQARPQVPSPELLSPISLTMESLSFPAKFLLSSQPQPSLLQGKGAPSFT